MGMDQIITGQNRALELALKGAGVDKTLDVLVRTVEEQAGHSTFASILLMDSEGKRLLTGAAPSLPSEYNNAIHGLEIGPFIGSCGRAAFMNEIVSVSDISTDPLWKDFKELALKFNLRACWSTPIVSSQGKVLGTFAIYRTQVGVPDPRDFEIVNLITRTAALLIERERDSDVRQKTESRLEMALNASRIGFWEYDYATNKIILSDILREDWGFDPFENVSSLDSALKLIHEDDVEFVAKAIEESGAKDTPYDVTYRIRRLTDGEIRWIWAKGQVLKNSLRHPLRLVGTSVDITAQRKVEKDLRDFEKQITTYAEAMPQMAFIADADGNILYYNKRFYDFIGVKDGDVKGWGWKDLSVIHPEDIDATAAVWKESLATGNFYETEYRIRRADGEFIWHIGRAIPFRDEDGRITRWYGTNTDIHEHKLELKKNEKFLDAVLQTIEAGVVACDADGNLTLFNRATSEFHGVPFEGLGSEKWADQYNLFRADGKTPMQTKDIPLFRALNGEKVENSEMVIVPKNGKTRFIRASGSQLIDVDGEKLGAVVAMHDITDLKKAEDDMRETNIALQSANQELEAFAYSVSHDLRAPLRGIDGFSKALLEDYGDKLEVDGKKYLGFVRDGVQRMGQLIDDMLKLSRVSRVEMHRNEVSLSAVAEDVVRRLQQMEPERKINFKIQPNIKVVGDPGLLTVLMENLIANSWKFTSKKTNSEIEFGVLASKSETAFYVKDNGSGFDMAYQSKLFGAFQRLHTNKEFKGTGIGLATVRRVVHRHGGRVWADAKPEQGATFYFTIGGGTHDNRH